MESRRLNGMVKRNAMLAVKIAQDGCIMSNSCLKAIVRNQVKDLVTLEVLGDDNFIDSCVSLMTKQN